MLAVRLMANISGINRGIPPLFGDTGEIGKSSQTSWRAALGITPDPKPTLADDPNVVRL